MTTSAANELLGGFGRVRWSRSEVARVDDVDELAHAVTTMPARGGLARGCGSSYGDTALSSGGRVVHLGGALATTAVDDARGVAVVGGGVVLAELLAALVPAGWFIPVVPGTGQVTVGGAIACDVHGKNHHTAGSFGSHVLSMRLLLASGEIVDVAPDRDPELFWATIGGLGLTGIVVEATIRLIAIESDAMWVDTVRRDHLDDVMTELVACDAASPYSIAWIDTTARRGRLGRGVVSTAQHAPSGSRVRGQSRAGSAARASFEQLPSLDVVNRATTTAFSSWRFQRASRRRTTAIESLTGFFHPLDALPGWNRFYGRQGFTQYQFVVPFDADRTVREVLARVQRVRLPVFLTVLKRLGPGNPAPLSFPRAGWTLALDVGVRHDGLAEVLRSLDELVLAAGGRHYLAKDFHITPATVRAGYPRLDRWQEVRRRVDPDGRWVSDLARRLDIDGRWS